ncbi:hypothetical protein EAG_04523 [Camponotus floridanus]|uniref:Laminin subunit alpha-2 n=1 Tax=Camponotus floridanus TaxID=104421 RepID=E2AAH6_CAMFO|nr:DNA ligase 1 [Camponotus floridanus]EFN69577.1 hypothetical protein EAG_04523 [Camponotus floridanus]
MARVALLVTVLAAVVYISQAIPVSENVEDEQLKSKEIFDQIQPESKEILDRVQPESKEILDQVQPESKEILDQNQSKSEEILDQIQPKSEENLDQPDDTSENELEDSKNKDWHDHRKENLKRKLEILEKILRDSEIRDNKWKTKGIERQIERIQQRTRRNSQYAPIDIANVNDIEKIFTDQLPSMLKDVFNSFVQDKNEFSKKFVESFFEIMNNVLTLFEKDEISENVENLKEKLIKFEADIDEEITDKKRNFSKNIVKKLKDLTNNVKNLQDLSKNVIERLMSEDDSKKMIENLKEQLPQQKKDISNILKVKKEIVEGILKIDVDKKIEVIYDVFKNLKNLQNIKDMFLNIIQLKLNNIKGAKQIITNLSPMFLKTIHDFLKDIVFKITENENGRIDILKGAIERFNEIKSKTKKGIEDSQIGEIFDNISKKPFIEKLPFNRLNDLSKDVLSKIKRD